MEEIISLAKENDETNFNTYLILSAMLKREIDLIMSYSSSSNIDKLMSAVSGADSDLYQEINGLFYYYHNSNVFTSAEYDWAISP